MFVIYRHLLAWTLYQNYTAMLALFVLCMLFGNSAAAISIRSVRAGSHPPLVPLWPQTLIKFQVSVVYFYAALAKCNALFLEGRVFRASLSWLTPFDHPALWTACALATILLEFAFVVCLWLPATRAWMIALGAAFHLGIIFTMGFFAAFIAFAIEFISIYLLYIQPKPDSLGWSGANTIFFVHWTGSVFSNWRPVLSLARRYLPSTEFARS